MGQILLSDKILRVHPPFFPSTIHSPTGSTYYMGASLQTTTEKLMNVVNSDNETFYKGNNSRWIRICDLREKKKTKNTLHPPDRFWKTSLKQWHLVKESMWGVTEAVTRLQGGARSCRHRDSQMQRCWGRNPSEKGMMAVVKLMGRAWDLQIWSYGRA